MAMTSKKLEIGLAVLVVLIVIVGGVYALTKSDSKKDDSNTNQSTSSHDHSDHEHEGATPVDAGDSSVDEATATLTYGDDGFSPAEITVKSGEKVAVKNASSEELEFESGPHPAHTSNSELNQGTVAPGEAVVFTVTSKGSFSVHNHLNPGNTARVVVE